MAVLLALAYGLSDFVGGVASCRASAWSVALTASVGATLATVVLAYVVAGEPSPTHLAWGLLAGLGNGGGTAILYRGFASGRMGVVGPVSAVGAALLSATHAITTGERPTVIVWVGMLAALPGIWMVSREPASGHGRALRAEGLSDGVLAGLGFGVMLTALGQVLAQAGFWPVVGTQVTSLLAVAGAAWLLGGDAAPRRPEDWWGIPAGVLGTLGVVGFMLARQQGLLSVAAVLTSLYPATTVLLATLVLHEKLHRGQSVGLALCALSVVCVALG